MLSLVGSVEGASGVLEALLNGVIRGTALAVLAALLLRSARGASAATRHLVLFATLAMQAALPLAALGARGAGGPAPFTGAAGKGWSAPVVALDLPPTPWLTALLGGVALVALVRVARVAWSLRGLRRLKRLSFPITSAQAARLPHWDVPGRRPEFRLSERIDTPMTVGFVQPVVLLPASLPDSLDDAELAQVALHELAHLRRWDDWTNLAQRLVEAVLFFHPGVRWIGRRLELERELACDQWVIATLPGERAYARCLTRLAELAGASRASRLAPGIAPRRGQLTHRVTALLRGGPGARPGVSPRFAALLLPGVLLTSAGVTVGVPGIALVAVTVGELLLPPVAAVAVQRTSPPPALGPEVAPGPEPAVGVAEHGLDARLLVLAPPGLAALAPPVDAQPRMAVADVRNRPATRPAADPVHARAGDRPRFALRVTLSISGPVGPGVAGRVTPPGADLMPGPAPRIFGGAPHLRVRGSGGWRPVPPPGVRR